MALKEIPTWSALYSSPTPSFYTFCPPHPIPATQFLLPILVLIDTPSSLLPQGFVLAIPSDEMFFSQLSRWLAFLPLLSLCLNAPAWGLSKPPSLKSTGPTPQNTPPLSLFYFSPWHLSASDILQKLLIYLLSFSPYPDISSLMMESINLFCLLSYPQCLAVAGR